MYGNNPMNYELIYVVTEIIINVFLMFVEILKIAIFCYILYIMIHVVMPILIIGCFVVSFIIVLFKTFMDIFKKSG